MDQVKLPAGYALHWSGQYEYLLRAQERLAIMGPLTLAIVLLLLYLNFQRFSEVLLIMITLPLAFAGGITLLYLLDYDLSVAVGVGFIALAGVTVELGVVMLTYLNMATDRMLATSSENNVEPTVDALKQSISVGTIGRLRPILMTTLTVIVGLLPVMLGDGTGSDVMRRIATPMIGGMLSATILTLIMLPALYYLWKRWLLLHRPALFVPSNAAIVNTG